MPRPKGPAPLSPPARPGFTLVELLVVIGIIAVLVGMLLPAVTRARFQAIFTTCAERQRQMVMAMQMYANEHKGYFPRHDLGSGGNLWDVAPETYSVLRERYGQPHTMFFCPDAREDLEADEYDTFLGPGGTSGFYLIGWLYWVPRANNGLIVPPDPGSPGFTIRDTEIFRGPIRMGDEFFNKNPVLTDLIIIYDDWPAGTDLSQDPRPMAPNYGAWTSHRWKGLLAGTNQAFADGHVVRFHGGEARPRYAGNYWNWR